MLYGICLMPLRNVKDWHNRDYGVSDATYGYDKQEAQCPHDIHDISLYVLIYQTILQPFTTYRIRCFMFI